MKRLLFILAALAVLAALSACSSTPAELHDGVYTATHTEAILEPYVSFDTEDQSFQFFYDPLSSYISVGHYTIEDDRLIATTDDLRHTFIFQIKSDDKIVFRQKESSEIQMIQGKSPVKNGTAFTLAQ